jgi:6-bladed beta-propeller
MTGMRLFPLIVPFVALLVAPLRAQQPDTIRLALKWEVTEVTHTVAESLGVLSGIAVDRLGTVYVSDRSASKIWVFDSLGRSQRGIGRKGQGPGEFQSPTGTP